MAVKDETGNKYDRLLVIKRAPNNKRGDAQWECQCDCGNIIIAKGVSLRSGHTKSCGCLQRNKVREQGLKNTYDLVGQKFGKLTVIERLAGNKDTRGKWRCRCECGTISEVTSDKLISGTTYSCGCSQSKREEIIAKILNEANISYGREYSFEDLRDINPLRFDFALFKDNKLFCLIEHDGIQHFNTDNVFYTEKLKENDIKKDEYCNKNNILLYRISYKDNLELKMQEIISNFKANS